MGIPSQNRSFIPAQLPYEWRDGYFTNRTGNAIHYGFAPAAGPSKGTVVLTHGYGEFIELYAEAIGEYQKMGFDVWAMDFQGFGKSKTSGADREMRQHVDDLHEFVTRIVRSERDKPVLMNTHSMGGHIGLLYLQQHPDMFDGAVMSAPMFDIYRLGLPVAARPAIQAIFNFASKVGLKDVPVPETPGLWTKMRNLFHKLAGREDGGLREEFYQKARKSIGEPAIKRPTAGWLSNVFETVAASTTEDALRSVKTPILIGSAGLENLVAVDAHEQAAQLMQDAKVVKLPTARHGLWFENDGNYNYWVGQVKNFTGRLTEQFELARARNTIPQPIFAAEHKIEVMPPRTAPKTPVFADSGLRPASI